MNNIKKADQKLAVVFITVIDTKTYSLQSNLLVPEKPSTKRYEELVDVLEAHLE